MASTFRYSEDYVGAPNAPGEIRRRRKSVSQMLHRMGTPVLVKHRFSDLDVQSGVAQPSPSFDDIYGQSRNEDPLSYGVGYVSVELSPNEWYDQQGNIIVSDTNPGAGYTQAPKYRGFGPGQITYVIEPDQAEDYFKSYLGGPIFKVQEAKAIAPWWPNIDDNDLLINITIDRNFKILDSGERYEAKMVNPVSMRGLQRRGRKEYTEDGGSRFVVNQQFEMVLLPESDVRYKVEIDR